jgi:hypothetical protein
MYRVLASLAPACNDRFTALLLPTAITIDPARGLLVLPHCDGEDLGARWSEADGGALLDAGLAAAIPAVLQDLARIDTRCVTSDPVPRAGRQRGCHQVARDATKPQADTQHAHSV